VCAVFKARRFAGFTPVIVFSEIYRPMFRRNFQKNWKIVGTSHNSPEYLTISREQRASSRLSFWQLRPTSLENLLTPIPLAHHVINCPGIEFAAGAVSPRSKSKE